MIGISEPETLKNQHIVTLKIEIFVLIGSKINECIDYAGYIDVVAGSWGRIRVVEMLLEKIRNWKV